MVEITVVLVIILGMAALLAPGFIGRVDQSRVDVSAESLQGVATAIHDPSRGGGSFQQHVGAYPGRLSHLTRQILPSSDVNSCGFAYSSDDSAGWSGPYLNRTVPATGVPIGIGTVRDEITRDSAFDGTSPVLRLHVDSVIIEDAGALDLVIDGVRDSAAGTVRWGAMDGDGFVTLDYLVPVKNC